MRCEETTPAPETVPFKAVDDLPSKSNSVTLIGLIDHSSPTFSEIGNEKVVRFLLIVPDLDPDEDLPPGMTYDDCSQKLPILGRGFFVEAFSACNFGGCLILMDGRLELTEEGLQVEILTWHRIA